MSEGAGKHTSEVRCTRTLGMACWWLTTALPGSPRTSYFPGPGPSSALERGPLVRLPNEKLGADARAEDTCTPSPDILTSNRVAGTLH